MRQPIVVWDIAIRAFHWALVLALVFLWWSGSQDQWMDFHPLVAYWVAALVTFRIVWGFCGTYWARFSSFVASPLATWRAIPATFGPQRKLYLSHNPLGAYMVLCMLASITVQVLTGLGTSDDVLIDGPLVDYLSSSWVAQLTSWHHINANILLVLVSLHLVAVVYHDAVLREGLTAAMFSGKKHSIHSVATEPMPWLRLLLTLFIIFGSLLYWLFHRP